MQYAKRAIRAAPGGDEQTVPAVARDYAARLSITADFAKAVRSFSNGAARNSAAASKMCSDRAAVCI
jgi:hypothetical protein